MPKLSTSFLIFFIFITVVLKAQDSTNLLDPVTVTATLSPIQASKTGRNITVISGAVFAKMPVNSLDELLRYVPGIEVQSRGPMGVQSDIIIRGGTFQQVLVVLDGIKLNDPLTGHFNSYIPIAPAEIERIEILKGASSAIYGTEAVGGVIHIITKSFSRNIKQSTANAQLTAGDYGLIAAQAGGTFTDGKNIVSGGLLTNHSSGQPQRGTNGFFDLSTASLSYTRVLNTHWNLGLRSAYDYRSFGAQNFYTAFGSDTAVERVKTWWNHAQLSYNSERLKWQTNVGYKAVDDDYKFNTAVSPNKNKSKIFQVLSTLDFRLAKNTTLTTGAQYLQKRIASNDRGNHTVWQNGIFAILHQQFGENLFVDPALRFDYNSRSGGEWVPQLNAVYKFNALQFRGSIGRTIRDADFTERFNNYNRTRVTSGSIGNPDLISETSWSWEIGADYRLNNALKISTGYFQRNQNNLIDFVTTPYANMPRKENLVPGGTYALALNISEVTSTGFETDLQWQKVFSPNQQISANLGLVWLKSKLPNGTAPGFYISSHAKFMTNFSILYQRQWLVVSINGLYKTRTERKAASPLILPVSANYFVVNAKVEIKIKKQFGVFVQVDNIGDVRYSDILGSVMPKRWLMGGIKWGF